MIDDLLTLPGRALRAVARRHQARQAADALLRLDDHLLRDIGASRADVDRLIRQGR